MKKLWLLRRIGARPVYDVNNVFVVRSRTEEAARAFAAEEAGDEGDATWVDPSLSTCEELSVDGESGVVASEGREG